MLGIVSQTKPKAIMTPAERSGRKGAKMGVNVIITCNHKECPYCHEGECGKPVIEINDSECVALKERGNKG